MLDWNSGTDQGKLNYLRRERDAKDELLKGMPPDSWKRPMVQGQRDQIDGQIKELEKAIAKGSAEGAEKGVTKALKDQTGGATVQQQSFNGLPGAAP